MRSYLCDNRKVHRNNEHIGLPGIADHKQKDMSFCKRKSVEDIKNLLMCINSVIYVVFEELPRSCIRIEHMIRLIQMPA